MRHGEWKSCGGCAECCWALRVDEVGAPAGVKCEHQVAAGCGIYTSPDRPTVCGAFACMWARDAPKIPYRPDECGVLVWRDAPQSVTLRELRDGALEADWVYDALDHYAKDNAVTMERLSLPPEGA